MIFLYLPLREYLFAILRSDNHRTWLRNVTTQLGKHVGGAIGALHNASDAQRAAALWLAQMQLYADAAGVMVNARSLDAETFFADPTTALTAAAAHFGVPLSPREIEARVGGRCSRPIRRTRHNRSETPIAWRVVTISRPSSPSISTKPNAGSPRARQKPRPHWRRCELFRSPFDRRVRDRGGVQRTRMPRTLRSPLIAMK
ncbi:hypothetical protein QP164_15660 [Sphingomonas sp. LR59]|uniref:hypothetical protein n=1 Tax=Sphingomonas sp. LR59 TaxID=3050232 RepID=UPI002FE13E04